jgi:DNA-binding MurR/RpiR family transcriptional regulator
LQTIFDHFTARQLEALVPARTGLSQSAIAEQMNVSKQAVSRLVRVSGWQGYRDAEEALRQALAIFAHAEPEMPTHG